jgi:hypothetical protein
MVICGFLIQTQEKFRGRGINDPVGMVVYY